MSAFILNGRCSGAKPGKGENSVARNRYVGDYRLVEDVSERGRIKTEYEYIGSPYAYTDEKAAARAKKNASAACALGWIAYIGAMLPVSAAMRTFYVSLPFIFSAVPLALLADTLLGVLRAKPPLEHRHADRLENRYPASAFFLLLLPLVSLIGEGIQLLTGAAMSAGDGVFALCAAALALCGAAAFRQRDRLKCRAMPSS